MGWRGGAHFVPLFKERDLLPLPPPPRRHKHPHLSPFFRMLLHNSHSTNAAAHWSRRRAKTIAGGNENRSANRISAGSSLRFWRKQRWSVYSPVSCTLGGKHGAHWAQRPRRRRRWQAWWQWWHKSNLTRVCPGAGLHAGLDAETCFVIKWWRILNWMCWWWGY